MKILFLDFDGVIIIGDEFRKPRQHLVDRINQITAATGAQVIISSSWRYHKDVYDNCRLWGIKPVIGRTPLGIELPSGITAALTRGKEIQAWLDANEKPESFCIIDDDFDLDPLKQFAIHTNFTIGIEEHHVAEAIMLLSA